MAQICHLEKGHVEVTHESFDIVFLGLGVQPIQELNQPRGLFVVCEAVVKVHHEHVVFAAHEANLVGHADFDNETPAVGNSLVAAATAAFVFPFFSSLAVEGFQASAFWPPLRPCPFLCQSLPPAATLLPWTLP